MRVTNEGMGLRFKRLDDESARKLKKHVARLTDVEHTRRTAEELLGADRSVIHPIEDAGRIARIFRPAGGRSRSGRPERDSAKAGVTFAPTAASARGRLPSKGHRFCNVQRTWDLPFLHATRAWPSDTRNNAAAACGGVPACARAAGAGGGRAAHAGGGATGTTVLGCRVQVRNGSPRPSPFPLATLGMHENTSTRG